MRRVAIPVALLLVGLTAGAASALLTDPASVDENAFSTATLQPPTGASAKASCQGFLTARIALNWTAASYADGYDVYRSTTNGGPYSLLAHVGGGSTTSYTDGSLGLSTTYYYVLRTTKNSWTSSDSSQVQATTPGLCL